MDITEHNIEDAPISVLQDMAKATEQEYEQEMSVKPKAAIGTEEPPATPDAQEPPKRGLFDYPDTDTATPAEQPAQQQRSPFAGLGSDDSNADANPKAMMAGMSIEQMLEVRHAFEAMIWAELDGDATADDYKLTDDEKALYQAVYEPYKNVASKKIPPMVWIIMVEAYCTGRRMMRALKNRRINIKNKQAAKVAKSADAPTPGGSMAQAAAKVVDLHPPGGKRTKFRIFADGTYMHTRETANKKAVYQAQGTGTPEKVDLHNLDHVKHVIRDNGWPKLQRAFDLPDEWLQSKGIDPDNLGIDDE